MSNFDFLYDSTLELFDRFDLNLDPDKMRRKFMEEATELITAHVVLGNYWGIPNKSEIRSVTVEVFDVIVMMIGMLESLNISREELERAFILGVIKNNQKTIETHEVVNNLIVRRRTE